MRRTHLVFIGAIVVICSLAIYVLLARPVLVLPTITVPVSESNAIGTYQRRLGINELNVILRTDGKLTITADGQPLARLSYTLASLNTTSGLAQQMLLPPTARTAMRVFPFLFRELTLNLYYTSLLMYYVLPVEMNIRIVRG